MADDRPIIIKRIKKSGGGHHGGAWKVAYADFVTAMMAFFLLLWLLNAVTEEQKKGIAQYFKPTIAPQSSQSQEAILNGTPAVMSEVSGASAAEASVDVDDSADDAASNPTAPVNPKPSPDAEMPSGSGGVTPSDAGAKPVDLKEAKDVVAKNEQKEFDDVKQKIEEQIKQDPGLADLKNNIDVRQTPEGLQIEMLDKDKVSMFPSGSASMNERSRQLMQLVARVIAPLPNKLSISGHTDATPYQGRPDYSNWELSTDRANAARRQLETFGVDDKRMENVAGKADTDPKIQNDPFSAENRRISIVLLREQPAAPPTAPASAAPAAPAPAAAAPAEPPPQIVPDAQPPTQPAAEGVSSEGATAEPQLPQSVTTP